MLKKILVPIDGSEPSWRALSYAETIGEKFESKVTVLHVIQPHYTLPAVSMNGEVPFITVNFEELESTGHKLLSTAKEKMQTDLKNFETSLEFGHPAERILVIAKEEQYDLIVIGSRGLSGIAEFLQGSISSTVSHYSTIPVLIVK